MSKSFEVEVNNSFHFKISSEDILNLDAISNKNGLHILLDHKSLQSEIVRSDFNKKRYTVSVNNNHYEVQIADSLDLLIKDMGFDLGSTKHIQAVYAPMPGLILDIHVKKGDSVNENDSLLILEAMKMENIITAPRDGIIKSIAVSTGKSIDKNQLLIEFE
ncbi:acetyl-CoA carboxylase biotin carboxyl carrier protein subunit [Gaetbulibacter saemankumensis]|uniref:acetyl-CoA carboxylase biotin carboxyl carrier protein subunit n=1 Tax=Gaetbulibacter saemankumensis TaxID=311208 RepID=UPI00041E3D98|nr:acetyl-CoA carboxylase biotin carboxyl carrier protein subunit [Gaetbulibacter saemankumensis]